MGRVGILAAWPGGVPMICQCPCGCRVRLSRLLAMITDRCGPCFRIDGPHSVARSRRMNSRSRRDRYPRPPAGKAF